MNLLAELMEMALARMTKSDDENLSKTFAPIDVTAVNMSLKHGLYSAKLKKLPFELYVHVGTLTDAEIEQLYDDVHKKDPDGVVFVINDNSSNDHVPLTPWMLMHRFVQDGLYQNRVSNPYKDELFWKITKRVVKRKFNDDSNELTSKDIDLLRRIATAPLFMRSARKHLLPTAEIRNEIGTEVAITGKLRLDVSKIRDVFKQYEIDATPEELSEIESGFKRTYERFAADAQTGLAALKGKLVKPLLYDTVAITKDQ